MVIAFRVIGELTANPVFARNAKQTDGSSRPIRKKVKRKNESLSLIDFGNIYLGGIAGR